MKIKPYLKSFVRRGAITSGQQRALNEHWDEFGINISEDLVLSEHPFWDTTSKKILDIGFGRGDSLITQVLAHPEWQWLGVEVHKPGLGHVLNTIVKNEIKNLKIINADIMQILPLIKQPFFDKVQVFFPDPWPKRAHRKRRLVQQPFLNALLPIIKKGGVLHLATDWDDYADSMLNLLKHCDTLCNTSSNNNYVARPAERPITAFEKKGLKKNHQIYDLIFIKN